MGYVIKINHENSLRRLRLENYELISFSALEARIRELFQLPDTARMVVTYTDQDNDTVVMANDQDIVDALVHQALNPLRVNVTLVSNEKCSGPGSPQFEKATTPDFRLRQVLNMLSSTPESLKHLLQSYEPVLQGVMPPGQISMLMENALRVSNHLAGVLINGTFTAPAVPFNPASVPSARPKNPNRQTSESTRSSSGAGDASAPTDRTGVEKGLSNFDNAVHHGISCDVCGVRPIVGLRWKSNKRYDYDLCSSCFEKHGNINEYTKIEQPVCRTRHFHHSPHYYGHRNWRPIPMGCHSVGPNAPSLGSSFHPAVPDLCVGKPWGSHSSYAGRHCSPGNFAGRLDARFVCDVTMFDGTEVAPGTHFTKIWRLRNSGTIAWPVSTCLIFVAGDEMGDVSTVPLGIPEGGLVPGGEMDVAVDLVAPEKLGRCLSHWRLASPSSPKFGHRIWVLVQVVPKDILEESSELVVTQEPAPPGTESVTGGEELVRELEIAVTSLNLESPVVDYGFEQSEAQAGDEEDAVLQGNTPPVGGSSVSVSREESVSSTPVHESMEDLEEHVTESSETGNSTTSTETVPAADRIKYPVLDFTSDEGFPTFQEASVPVFQLHEEGRVTYPVVLPVTYPLVESLVEPVSHPLVEVQDERPVAYPVEPVAVDTRKVLLAKLLAMGFADEKLNLEILDRNNLDMRKTLDDLCAVEEWDPILEELEEMGFYDKDMNRRLMFKNNGSVKRVVKELVQIYKDHQEESRKLQ